MNRCNEDRELEHVVLLFSSVSSIDETALESIKRMIVNLRESGITLHLSDVKGMIRDQLKLTDILDVLAPGKLFYTADEAMRFLQSDKDSCD